MPDRQAAGARRLSWEERRFLFILGLPAFGIALAYTLVTTYVPVLINELSGPTITGLLIAGEGLFALFIPVLVGGMSDQLRTRIGGRLPLILIGGVIAVLALILMPLGTTSLTWVAVALAIFFVGYFTYYTPYYALYPDLVPDDAHGRSQGFQGTLRSAGLLIALGGGGFLLSLGQPLPFFVGAAAIIVVTVGLYIGVRTGSAHGERHTDQRGGFSASLTLLRTDVRIRHWFIANACWEAAIAGLRTFAVLYLTVGLGLSLAKASSALALVGVAALLAAPVAGKLADHYGDRRIMYLALWVFALGLTPAVVTTDMAFVATIVPVAFAAVVLMTLPYALLMGLLTRRSTHGTGAGLFGMSRGIGVLAGPLLAGIAADQAEHLSVLTFSDTQGYSAIFVVAALMLFGSMPLLRRIT
ncbi:MAG: MFS transporter [Haloechinothrix sp.]